jgi:hypothetical protein
MESGSISWQHTIAVHSLGLRTVEENVCDLNDHTIDLVMHFSQRKNYDPQNICELAGGRFDAIHVILR